MSQTDNNRDVRAFRVDINGLRAWAVVAVILYHFGVPGFTGGFVGVDVFFVISGFLMTSIIVAGLEYRKFSLMNFYLARAKRILPALMALCVTLLLMGWFVLAQGEYKTLAHHVISALTFSSNSTFWKESGYFDVSSYDKWLLHTWSLSVEWQFYLVLPMALMAAWKFKPSHLSAFVVLSVVAMVSLLASISLSSTYPSASFYLLPMRAWEMLLGGLVFLISLRLPASGTAAKCIALLGFTLIAYSIAFISPSDVWPGWHALIPVLGTSCVIAASVQDSPLTNLRALQWLGDRSYSLYLWHWPIAAALVYLELRQDIGATTAGLLITLILGHISYSAIELKSKSILTANSTRTAYLTIVAAMALILVPSQLIKTDDGVPSRPVAINSSRIFHDSSLRNPRLRECFVNASKNKVITSQCSYGGNELGAIVIGDSHAASIVRAVERSLPSKSLNVLDWELHSCATILGLKLITDPKNTCSEFLELAVEKQKSLPADVPIIIVNRWSTYLFGPNEPDRQAEVSTPTFYIDKPYPPKAPELLAKMREGIISTACEFAKTRPVYLVRPFPELKISVPKTMARRAFIPGSNKRVFISMEEYMQRNEFVWEAQDAASKKCGVRILNPLPYLCSDGKCYGDHNGTPIYVDDDHLNEHGGDALIPMFSEAFHSQDSQQTATSHHVNAAAQ
ncbi:acyltransferase family protein [Pseudomonas sp. SK2]|uniref:acyltransferase family protein n=1 Tax=Pseudomonas sp. SK2 TaxID=2841063 RepID=UPI00192BA5DC|nr:acyltransferase family protein [Pseudomonas sp. SK2]QQZ37606.1 acyltransferase [Pseudomonas sp. SK2]